MKDPTVKDTTRTKIIDTEPAHPPSVPQKMAPIGSIRTNAPKAALERKARNGGKVTQTKIR